MTEKKVKCPSCQKKVEVQKGDHPNGQCPNCGHPFRSKDLGIEPEE